MLKDGIQTPQARDCHHATCQANKTEPDLAGDEGGSSRNILRGHHSCGEVTMVHKWQMFQIHLQVGVIGFMWLLFL